MPAALGFARLWAAAVLLPLAALAAAGWWSWNSVHSAAQAEMARSVGMVHEQVLRTLDNQETVLAGMEAFVANLDWPAMRASRAAHDFARRIEQTSQTITALGVVDPAGRVAVASETPDPPQRLDLSDRDYVRAFPPGTASRALFISSVVVSRVDGRIQVHSARPRIAPDGTADGGVIVASFPPSHFETLFAEAAETTMTGFMILRGDGSVLARFPDPVLREGDRLAEDDPALRAARRAAAAPAEQKITFQGGLWPFAGSAMLVARPIRRFDLAVVHRLDPAVPIGRWTQQMAAPTLGAAAAMALLLLLTLRTQQRIALAQAALRQRAQRAEAAARLDRERAALEADLRQAEKVATLGQLAAGVAHDFNNLLQTVVLNAELLERAEDLPPAARRSAALILRASASGKALTRRMLDQSRRNDAIQPGQRMDVAATLHDAASLLARALAPRHRLTITVPPALPPVQGDAAEFELAVVNLVLNARDAMPSGGDVAITAAAMRPPPGAMPEAATPAGDFVCVLVRDHGEGMDAATLARAGEAFFTTKPRGAGTGLGLSMVRGFARAAGGGLELDSVPGRGTCARLWLPVVPP